MLMPILAHPGHAVTPDEIWGQWNLDPVLVMMFGGAIWLYWRGSRMADTVTGGASRQGDGWFALGIGALLVALVSPLDALSGALSSAHMAQHLLILLVAAPALAMAGVSHVMMLGLPRSVRKLIGRWRRRLRLTPGRLRALSHPAAIWMLHAGILWFWHAAGPYNAALENGLVHDLEHLTFLVTGTLFWKVVVTRHNTTRTSMGYRILMLFTMATQGVLLAALITFAETPWYSYSGTTAPWGLTPLADQQLAGVIMWIPSGPIYTLAGLILLVLWIRGSGSVPIQAKRVNIVRDDPRSASR